jgi:hypothetical protein
LRSHKRLQLPVRTDGIFEFMLHEARLKPTIEKVTINRSSSGAATKFVKHYVAQLRYWNPEATIEVIGKTGTDDKEPSKPIAIEKSKPATHQACECKAAANPFAVNRHTRP